MSKEIIKVEKILIKKNPNGDTRTASKDVSFEEFQKANDMHIDDVRQVMKQISNVIENRGNIHDYTKKVLEELFYNDFKSTMNEGTNFIEGNWYNMHTLTERHHLLARCPDDVNLIDVIEAPFAMNRPLTTIDGIQYPLHFMELQ